MANTPYYLPPSSMQTAQVGSLYHIACSATLPAASGATGPNTLGTVTYGFMLKPQVGSTLSYQQRTDVTTKQDLVQYSSPNLIDRDLVFYPRVSDGDFSGGMLQATFINAQKYWDSNLNITLPGYLQLSPAWVEIAGSNGAGSMTGVFAVAAGNYVVVSNTGGFIMSINSTGTAQSASVTTPVALATDGSYAYSCSAATVVQYAPATGAKVTVASAVNGTLSGAWVVNMGGNGFFLYYNGGSGNLYKIDISNPSAWPIAAINQPQVALGNSVTQVVDVCAYQTGVAILTTNLVGNLNDGTTLWYNDNQTTTPITTIPGYAPLGMCNCQGNLYVVATPAGYGPVVLFQITSGVVTEVLSYGPPIVFAGNTVSGPVASADAVYFNYISGAMQQIDTNYTVKYNVVTGATSHLPQQIGSFTTTPSRPVIWGGAVAYGYGTAANGGTIFAQIQDTAGSNFTALQTYNSTGWMLSSAIDAQTPTIPKQFHEVDVTHMPLPAGSTLSVYAWADMDPTTIIPGTTAPTVTAVVNSTTGSTLTTLTLPGQIVAKSIVVGIKLTAGTSALTTPVVKWFSVEISTPWAFEFYIDCTEKQRLLDGALDDPQGIQAQDKTWFWWNANENPGPITVYVPNAAGGQHSYVCEAETLEITNPGPFFTQNPQSNSTAESFVHVVLRQSQ